MPPTRRGEGKLLRSTRRVPPPNYNTPPAATAANKKKIMKTSTTGATTTGSSSNTTEGPTTSTRKKKKITARSKRRGTASETEANKNNEDTTMTNKKPRLEDDDSSTNTTTSNSESEDLFDRDYNANGGDLDDSSMISTSTSGGSFDGSATTTSGAEKPSGKEATGEGKRRKNGDKANESALQGMVEEMVRQMVKKVWDKKMDGPTEQQKGQQKRQASVRKVSAAIVPTTGVRSTSNADEKGELSVKDIKYLRTKKVGIRRMLRHYMKYEWYGGMKFTPTKHEGISKNILRESVETGMVTIPRKSINREGFYEHFWNLVPKTLAQLRHNTQTLARKNWKGEQHY